jgi:hypothetical protein
MVLLPKKWNIGSSFSNISSSGSVRDPELKVGTGEFGAGFVRVFDWVLACMSARAMPEVALLSPRGRGCAPRGVSGALSVLTCLGKVATRGRAPPVAFRCGCGEG